MSETIPIPEWAITEARAIMTANGFENASDDTFVTGFVALGILSRDERAAKIAEDMPVLEPASNIYIMGWGGARAFIASAIRDRTKP